MHKNWSNQVVEETEINDKIPLFGRGVDILVKKIFERIMTKDEYEVWYISNFLDIGTRTQIVHAMKILENRHIVLRIKSYPLFWKRKI